MSIAKPRSRCPRCANPIAWYDNLPVMSWLWLRGQCRHCSLRISFRYPGVELLTGALFLAVLFVMTRAEGADAMLKYPLDFGAEWLSFFVFALITSVLISLSLIDYDYRILPDELTKSGIVLGPILGFLAPELHHGRFIISPSSGLLESLGSWAPRVAAFGTGVIAAVIAGGLLWLIGYLGTKAFKKDAMGFGDVKMMAAMGACQGLWALLALAVAAILGAVIGIVARMAGKGRYIPFGPFLAIGMWTVMLWGPAILEGYLGVFRPR